MPIPRAQRSPSAGCSAVVTPANPCWGAPAGPTMGEPSAGRNPQTQADRAFAKKSAALSSYPFISLKKEERTTSAPPLGGLRPPGSNPDATLTLRIPSHPASPRLATLARNGVRFAHQITGHWGTRAAPPKPPWQVFKAPWEGPVFLELLLRNSGSPYERKCRPLDHRRSSGGSVSLTTCSISRCP